MMCKKNYSGKKHQHTLKNTVISTKHRKILYIGKTVAGSIHDYALFKSECPPQTLRDRGRHSRGRVARDKASFWTVVPAMRRVLVRIGGGARHNVLAV